jgi:two-component system, NarL family, nitrate/nitrite response regulator NarL
MVEPQRLAEELRIPMEEKRIRLVLLDDENLLRAGLARLLASESGMEVAGECGSCAEALEILKRSAVDLVLLDFHIGEENAGDFMAAAQAAGYRGRFLILASATDARASAQALSLGAAGVFLKSGGPDRLVEAIRLVSTGAVWVDQKVIQCLAGQYVHDPDPPNERRMDARAGLEEKVLSGILEGLTNKKIADGLGLSESSVKNILQGLFSKTGVRTRSQLVRIALEGSTAYHETRSLSADAIAE